MASIYRWQINCRDLRKYLKHLLVFWIAVLIMLPQTKPASAAAVFNITPITWNVVGLDSNNVNVGPNNFPVGVKVCNAGTVATNVEATFAWDDELDLYTGNTFINLRSGSLSSVTLSSLPGGNACHDFYFEVTVTRRADAYDKTRRYHITVTADGGISLTTPRPREIYVEHLISQNRNATSAINLDGEPVPVGGNMTLMVGNTYNIELVGATATQGYEQIETFINFPNTIFQINVVTTTYSAYPTPHTDSLWDKKLYADGCHWENDPNSPNYRSCWSTGKYGGTVNVIYNVTIIGGAGTSRSLNSLIYDFSGSSYHYNSDFSAGSRVISIISASSVTMAKRFIPDAIVPGGTSTLMITISNPAAVSVSGVNFTDPLPTSPANMVVAATPNDSITGCGLATFNPLANDTTLSFSDGTIAPNSSCIIKVNVTAPIGGTYVNTTGHLFIDETTDTGNTAGATLTAAAAASCTPDVTMANWTIPVGTIANPPDTTGGIPTIKATNVTTATASAFIPAKTGIVTTGGSNDTTAWSTYGYKNSGQYIDFVVDTRHYSAVSMSFYVKNDGVSVGPTQLVVSYNTGSGFSNILTVNNPADIFTNHTIDFTGLTSGSGNTAFRISGTGANNDNSGAGVALDNIKFSGCSQLSPAPTLSKSFQDLAIPVGTTTRLTFSLSNTQPGNEALTGVHFTDTLPNGLQVADTPNASTTCVGSPTWSPTAGATTLTFGSPTGATMAAGNSCTARVDVKATKAGQFDNVSSYISATESGENKGANGYATATLTAIAPPAIAKSFAVSSIYTGASTTMTITAQNPNQSSSLSGIGFTDVLTGGLVVATPNGLNGDCGGGSISAVAGSSLVSLSGASLAGGASCSFSVDVTGTTAGIKDNITSAVTSTEGGNGNAASASLEVKDATPRINLLKQVSLTGADPWTSFVAVNPALPKDVYFRFIVENTGDTALSNVGISDVSLPGLDLSDCASALSGGLALYESKTCVSGAESVSVSDAYTNTAYATSDTANSINANARYATTDLTMVKTLGEAYFAGAGNILHYSYTVTNTGNAPLIFPVTIADDKADDESCPGTDTVGDLDNYLDPGESLVCSATYIVQSSDVSEGTVTNVASATTEGVTSLTDTETSTYAPMDFGDLPAVYTDTLWIDDGARHILDGLSLGISVTEKTDGMEDAAASADASDNGVEFTGNWSDGTGNITVTVSGGKGCLMGWLDFWDGNTPYTADGDFNDADELIINNQPVEAGATPFSFTLPSGAANSGDWFARFRLAPDENNDGVCSDQAAVGLTGLVTGGEVEDYRIGFGPTSVTTTRISAKSNKLLSPAILIVGLFSLGLCSVIWRRFYKLWMSR